MPLGIRKKIKSVAKEAVSAAVSEVKSVAKDVASAAIENIVNRLDKALADIENGNLKLLDDTGCRSDSGSDSYSDEEEEDMLSLKLAGVSRYLKLAEIAYKDESIAENPDFPFVMKSRLVKNVHSSNPIVRYKHHNFLKTDTEVHVCLLHYGSLAFAFRGTETTFCNKSVVRDWATDMLKRLVPVIHYNGSDDQVYDGRESDIKAHKGFLLAFQDVTRTCKPDENIKLVAEGLGAPEEKVRRVICIGHSLGGALATLCAHWCRRVAYPKAEIYCITIGSPRVGNWSFAKDFKRCVGKDRSFRLVNKGDIVAQVPIFSILTGYKHVCGRMHLLKDQNREGKIYISRRRIFVKSLSIRNHFMRSYTKAVQRALPFLHEDLDRGLPLSTIHTIS